jgi:hypothetical protein
MAIDRRGGAVRLATVVLLAVIAAGSVRAQDAVEAFYKGRQINLIVGYVVGRRLRPHGAAAGAAFRTLHTNPSIAVQNLAGAGSLRAANFMYGAAPKVNLRASNCTPELIPIDPIIEMSLCRRGAPIVLGGTREGARDADLGLSHLGRIALTAEIEGTARTAPPVEAAQSARRGRTARFLMVRYYQRIRGGAGTLPPVRHDRTSRVRQSGFFAKGLAFPERFDSSKISSA